MWTSLLSRFGPDLSLKHVQNQEQSMDAMEKTLRHERVQKGLAVNRSFVIAKALGGKDCRR